MADHEPHDFFGELFGEDFNKTIDEVANNIKRVVGFVGPKVSPRGQPDVANLTAQLAEKERELARLNSVVDQNIDYINNLNATLLTVTRERDALAEQASERRQGSVNTNPGPEPFVEEK